MTAPSLHWLPKEADWRARLATIAGPECWARAVALANTDMDFVRTNALDKRVRQALGVTPPPGLAAPPIRLAVLGSSTLTHLLPALRIAAVRRGMWLDTFEGEYGQYRTDVADPASALHAWRPTAVLFAFDAAYLCAPLAAGADAAEADAALANMRDQIAACWRLARAAFGCTVLQQTVLPTHAPLTGGGEHRLPGSRAGFVRRLNAMLRELADAEGADLLALDDRAARDGLAAWYDPALWHRSKQEVTPLAAPLYGELAVRVLAAKMGLSRKALVLDLDNTLWGGVIGDDGLEGIVLGQGSALGEGFLAVQDYAREQARRGVILAVCSKNDEANALEVFDRHPEMKLRRGDIACFVANWDDKATNIRRIAQQLNIGLDSLVFLDDNPFERALVRAELPMVAVPEVPEEPALVPGALADAGYFEAVALTEEDRARGAQYQANLARDSLRARVTDMDGTLRSLEMRLVWRGFDRLGLPRIVQLINKTNQFNLTSRRTTEAEVMAVMQDPGAVGLQLRLLDRFGDNGIIAIVIGRLASCGAELVIETWLMSCRVLGRQVEQGTLNILAQEAARLGAARLAGLYVPTAKNGMVREHYARLGFTPAGTSADGASRSTLDLAGFVPYQTTARIEAG